MDAYLYEESLDDSKPETIAISKEVLYIQDTNSGVYNGQIVFDTSSLSNSGKWLAWSQAELQIPFIVSFTSAANLAAGVRAAAFTMGLKNGYYQIIDSLQIDYNNVNIQQLSNNLNQFVNYKVLSTWSRSDLDKWSSMYGVYPDDPAYAAANANLNTASTTGTGFPNNTDRIAAASFAHPYPSNSGFYQRKIRNTAFSALAANPAYGNFANLNVADVGKNHYNVSGAGAGAVYYYVILCTIPLSLLSDFMAKAPLLRGGFFRLTINYNSCSHSITTVGNPATMTMASTTILSGRTCPYLITSFAANNGGTEVGTRVGANGLTLSCGVARNTSIASPANLPFSSCRLYVPAYELDPTKEAQLLQIKPIRQVNYTDIYTYTFSDSGAGTNFNQLITNGIAGMKYLVLIPYARYSVAQGGAAITNIPTAALSPFDTFPGTGSTPLAALSNFNVQVGGRNIFQQNFQYDFEFFINEVASMNAINGGAQWGLTSGLIDFAFWQNAYRYYVVNLERRASIEDGVPKSVQILGKNSSGYAMDYTCIIVYDRKVSIDMTEARVVS